jgi:hypothetical protein
MRPPWAGPRATAVGLVAANAVPLVGVVGFGWDLHSLLVVYWIENAVVGLASVAKIHHAEGADDPEELPSIAFNGRQLASLVGLSNRRIAALFVGHYSAFWIAHGGFVVSFPSMFPRMDWASPGIVAVAAVGLVAYHAASYRVDYVGERKYEHSGPVTLMIEPYRRVLVLHLTVLLAAFAVSAVGSPVGALAVMVLMKTVLDLRGHWKEHDRARRRLPSTTVQE